MDPKKDGGERYTETPVDMCHRLGWHNVIKSDLSIWRAATRHIGEMEGHLMANCTKCDSTLVFPHLLERGQVLLADVSDICSGHAPRDIYNVCLSIAIDAAFVMGLSREKVVEMLLAAWDVGYGGGK